MSDKFLFDLSLSWALAADDSQWIVLRRRNLRTQAGWKPVSYVASNKTTLQRVLKKQGVVLTNDAERLLSEMSERFLDWQIDLKLQRRGQSNV